MKKLYYLSLILLLLPLGLNAQNLVRNPSFEDTLSNGCPVGLGMYGNVKYWSQINSADYFHFCANQQVGVPNNYFGFQCPSSGSAYCGIYTYSQFWMPGIEYLQGNLIQPTEIGKKYFVSFEISLADGINCGIDKIGLLFTNKFLGDTSIDISFNNFSHVHSSEVIIDTVNWIRISGSFIADSSYNRFWIGNFYNNNSTICFDNSASKYSYYYIDNICIAEDSTTCLNISHENICIQTSLNEAQKLENLIPYPNPTDGILNFSLVDELYSISLMNTLGYEVDISKYLLSNNKIDIKELSNGIYILKVQYKSHVNYFRIFKK